MSIYSEVDVNTRERTALPVGSYGTGKQAGLKILSYVGEKPEKKNPDNLRHSFLVAATRPSREALQAAAARTTNGHGTNPLDEPDYQGTAFMVVTLNEMWLAPESVALAWTEASRNKEGVIQKDLTKPAIESGDATEESIAKCRAHWRKVATDKVIAANTPEAELEAAVEKQYRKELQQISIKIGQFFALQDWKNGGDKTKRDPQADPAFLVGAEFSGKVETSTVGKGGSEVSAVYSNDVKK